MKQNFNLLLLIFWLFASAQFGQAQVSCNNNVYLSLDNNGIGILTADMLVEGPVIWDSEVLVPSMVDCSDIGTPVTVTVTVTTNGVSETCFSIVTVEDKLDPIPYAYNDITVALDDNCEAHIFPSLLDAGTYDNCDFSMETDPTVFDCSHSGQTLPVDLIATDDSGNSDFAISNVTIVPNTMTQSASKDDTITVDPWSSTVTVNPSNVLVDPSLADSVIITPSTISCEFADQTISVDVIQMINGIAHTSISDIHILNPHPPVVIVEQGITITLGANYQFLLTPEMIDNGSYSNCHPLSLSVEPSLLDCSHVGDVQVTLTAELPNGITNSAWTTVTVVGDTPNLACNNGTTATMSIPPGGGAEMVQIYASDILEGGPYCGADSSYELQVLDNAGNVITSGIGSINMFAAGTYTIIITQPTTGNSCWGELIIESFAGGTGCEPLACNSNVTFQLSGAGQDEPVTIYTDQLLEGAYTCDLTQLELVIWYDQNFVVPVVEGAGSMSMPYSGSYYYQIQEPNSNNTCWGELTILGNNPCPPANMEGPTDTVIIVNVLGLTPATVSNELSPENLVANYGFLESQVQPNWNTNSCSLIAWTWEDVVFDLGNGSFKIVRTFTVLDWLTGDTHQSVQVIRNLIDTDFICDFLPHNTPITDCDLGHSDNDDVEWPADIQIADHRILPAELISFSNVDPMDASPTFYNDPSLYTATYIDVLETLTDTTIIFNRIWTVERDGFTGFVWSYGQNITVDFSDFSNLVTVSTHSDRTVPGVNVNGVDETNELGQATVDENDILDPNRDDTQLNGLNVLDMVLMREHILSMNTLSYHQQLCADMDQNSVISTLDLVAAAKIILELPTTFNSDWFFLDETDMVTTNIKPRAHYTALKRGDINDDAILTTGSNLNTVEASFTDIILNKGQIYNIKINLETDMNILASQLAFNINPDNVFVEGIEGITSEWSTNVDGRLLTLNFDPSNSADGIITVVVRALENSILSQNFEFNTDRASYIVDLNNQLLEINGTVENEITSGLNDLEELENQVLVYPNPASHQINIDMSDLELDGDVQFRLIDLSGKTVLTEINPNTIYLSDLSNGMYVYQILVGGKIQYGKLSISK